MQRMSGIKIVLGSSDEHLGDAARIWAEATAARDGDPEIASLAMARPVIEQVMHRSLESLLLIAVDRRSVGFAVAEPSDAHSRRFELRYLGVHPEAWGTGVGATLLAALCDELRRRGCSESELWVYGDNHRAVTLYQRMGWQPLSASRIHPRSGRLEQRYKLVIAVAG